MRSTFQDHTREQRTEDTYAVAGIIDDKLMVSQVSGINMTAPSAALNGYRALTGKVEETYLTPAHVREIEDEEIAGAWHKYEISDLVSGRTEVAVFLIGSRRI